MAKASAIARALDAAAAKRVAGRRPDDDGWNDARRRCAEEAAALLRACALERGGLRLPGDAGIVSSYALDAFAAAVEAEARDA